MKRISLYSLCAIFLAAVAVFAGLNFHNSTGDVVATMDPVDPVSVPVKAVGVIEQAEVSLHPTKDKPTEHSVPASLQDPVSDALKKIQSRVVGERIAGIQELTRLSPPDAVSVLYESLNRLQAEPDIEGMIVLGMLNLAQADQYLTDSDLEYLFHNSVNDNISGRAARILAARGDQHLLVEHIDKFKWQGDIYSTESATRNLTELGALETQLALPHIVPYLSSSNEDVRLQALLAVSLCGNAENIEQVKPLLSDASESVRERAEAVVQALESMGNREPAPIDMAVAHSYGT